MRATQQIFRIRRQYNQWVANQTLEDFALRFTAKKARRWSAGQVSMTALGTTAFLALEAIGGAITLNYGFVNAFTAILAVGLVIFITGFPITYYAARQGLDIDLLTRGAGFGYLGSTITSLIYASFTFIFFAIEAAILAMALKALFGIPVALGYVLCALAVIPIVTHGFTFISKFQLGTQPFWLVLQCIALFAVLSSDVTLLDEWAHYKGSEQKELGGGFELLLFGAAASVLFAMVAQIGEQVDYLRFLPSKQSTPPWRWWTALIAAGPGWILIGIVKMLIGSFLAFLIFRQGLPLEAATDPTLMYQMAFNSITHSPQLSLALAGVMVIISQMKINVTNAYAGSIAWSNFFSRLTHSHPGRVVWLFFNVSIALLLMELNIYRVLENILGIFAVVAVGWLGSLSADLLINKPLGLSPPYAEFKRAHLYDINPVGVGSMITASVVGVLCYLNVFGGIVQSLAHFATLLTTFVMVPLLGYLSRGRYYIAREPSLARDLDSDYQCCICENHFDYEDMSHCPAYQGPICSLCCSLDARCQDSCKPDARIATQMQHFFSGILPESGVRKLNSRLGHFLVILSAISLLNAALLALAYYHIASGSEAAAASHLVEDMLWTLFFVLMIISGILAWLYLLAHESRLVAQEESNRQNYLLIQEVEAHKETDRELQQAKEHAEAANFAKSRYLSGISHELRTPLQSILGYAQLLSSDTSIPDERKEAVHIIRRSGEYLADLIEGLLDISRIEAGRLDIRTEQVDLHALLSQLVDMFRLQAQSKSIDFIYECSPHLPQYVHSDEKRLRQILINLLSNAIKFTERGSVTLRIRYRTQVAEFSIVDTGVGIEADDRERIFSPFERVRKPHVPVVPGTGLGLTIVRLLVEIMGGDISLVSTPGQGSCFTASLMLSRVYKPHIAAPPQENICGYRGPRRTVLVVDDEPNHRGLIGDLLAPLGFAVMQAADAYSCLEMVGHCKPDVYLLDVSLPGMDGFELARELRQSGIDAPMIMISAEAQESPNDYNGQPVHDAYLVKPIRLSHLQEKLASLLGLQWLHGSEVKSAKMPSLAVAAPVPHHPVLARLRSYAEIGYAKGFKDLLNQLEPSDGVDPELIEYLQYLSKQARFDKIAALLEVGK